MSTFLQFVFEKIYSKLGLPFLATLVILSLIFQLHEYKLARQLPQMRGEWNIAIAPFSVQGKEDNLSLKDAISLSEQFYFSFESEIKKINSSTAIQLLGPETVPPILGESQDERALYAREIAIELDADLVLFGVIGKNGSTFFIKPEFYLNRNNSYELDELSGQHNLCDEIPLIGVDQINIPSQINLNREFTNRALTLALIAQGLNEYFFSDYGRAFTLFTIANSDNHWNTELGRETMYLLQSNAALKAQMYSQAEIFYLEALEANPEYSRALVGLGGLYYSLAMMEASSTTFQPDQALLEQSLAYYERAVHASVHPTTADINAKVFFGRGQVYLAQFFAGQTTLISPAFENFTKVISLYYSGEEYPSTIELQNICSPLKESGLPKANTLDSILSSTATWALSGLPVTNPLNDLQPEVSPINTRLTELASEAFARIGLIRRQAKDNVQAIQCFETAAKLSSSPARRALYLATLSDLYRIVHRFKKAISTTQEAIIQYRIAIDLSATELQQSRLWSALGNRYMEQEAYILAKSAYLKAIDLLSPESPELRKLEEKIRLIPDD